LIFCRGEVRRQGVIRRSCAATRNVELEAGGRGRRRGRWPSSPVRSSSAGFRSSSSPPYDRSAASRVVERSRRPSSASLRGSATSTVSLTRSSIPSLTPTSGAPSDVSSDSKPASTLPRRVAIGPAAADWRQGGAEASNEVSLKVDNQ